MDSKSNYRYIKVIEVLRDLITSGDYAVGDRLPGEREIARMMNVSQMTANRAIRHLVDEGYLQREVGVGTFVVSTDPTRAGRQMRIHVVLFGEASPDLVDRDVYLGPLWQAIWNEGAKQRCSFAFFQAAEPGALLDYAARLNPNTERLLLVTPPSLYVEEVAALRQQSQVRFVVLGAHWDDLDIPYVDCDNHAAAEAVVNYLVDKGHRNIAYVGTWIEHQNTRDRIEGYERALKRRGIDVKPAWQVTLDPGQLDSETFQSAVADLLQLDPKSRPTAILAGGYFLTLGVRKALDRIGVSVPDDVSLIGFDDAVSAEFLHPPLTMVRQPLERMGVAAVREVIGGQGEINALFPAELIKRQSVRSIEGAPVHKPKANR